MLVVCVLVWTVVTWVSVRLSVVVTVRRTKVGLLFLIRSGL